MRGTGCMLASALQPGWRRIPPSTNAWYERSNTSSKKCRTCLLAVNEPVRPVDAAILCKAFRKARKTDAADAAAICEAVTRPSMRVCRHQERSLLSLIEPPRMNNLLKAHI
jgi:hypothetical protein